MEYKFWQWYLMAHKEEMRFMEGKRACLHNEIIKRKWYTSKPKLKLWEK